MSKIIIIHAPADAIWQVIRDFGASCRYLPMVVNCAVAGAGVGALRTIYAKLHVTNRTQAALYALRQGWAALGESPE